MFGIEKDFQQLMEQAYGPLGEKQQMTELEEVKAQLKVLEKKLSFLEELEKTKSPVEEAFKDWMGEYPPTTPSVDGIDDIRWKAFQMGYNSSKEKKVSESFQAGYEFAYQQNVSEWEPTPQTSEQVADGLKEAFREAIKQGIIPEIKQPTDELIDKLTKNPPEFLKFELGKTLTDLIYRWWEDVFTTHSDWDMETSIEDLVDQIELWLPKSQSAAGSQSIGVEELVQGFNDCLNKIKSKLR
jgi:hypothetical protein